jgi:Holliday junction resolvasome RuvABC endonuclease subunit
VRVLGIDLAIATCGYGVVEPVPDERTRVLDIDLIETAANDATDSSVDDARRLNRIGVRLAEVIRRFDIRRIAMEQRLEHGAKRALAVQALCSGLVQGLAVAFDADLVELVARTWQDAVVPGVFKQPKPTRYPLIERSLAGFIGDRLAHIAPGKRNHPLDGFGIALCTALRPGLCRVIRRASALPVERTEGAVA